MLTSPATALALEGVTKRFRNGIVAVNDVSLSLGTMAHAPKLFAGVAMLFFYVVMSSPHAAEFDFAGWNGAATNGVRVAYFVAAIALVGVAVLAEWYGARCERA